MDSQNLAEMMQTLEAGRQEFIASVQGLSDEQAAAKPAPDRWSVLECMEHVVVVEGRFLGWIEEGKPLEQSQPNPSKEAEITALMSDRTTRREAPAVVQPSGRFATLASALEEFQAIRDRSAKLAAGRGEALYSVQAEHPRFGALNGAEVIYMIAGHAGRHCAQMREARAALGF